MNPKKIFLTACLLLLTFFSFAQMQQKTDNLKVNQSFTPPVYANAATRDAAITNPSNGMIIYNIATGEMEVYSTASSAWTTTTATKFVDGTTAADAVFTTGNVGIGTTTPEGALDVKSTTTGLVVPRVANTAAVVNPQGGAIPNGTLIYDLSSNCIKAYENSSWTSCLSLVPPSPSETVLAQIGREADDPDVVNSVVTVAQLQTITPALTGLNPANEVAYQDYIDANPNLFSSPATQPEVQAMKDAVNAANACPTTATVVINGAPTIACDGSDVALSSSYTSADTTYAWTADNGATFDDATSATPNLTLPNTDVNVTVNLTVTKAGCSPSSVSATPVTINVDVAPAVSITGVMCLDVEISDYTDDPLSIRQQIPDDFTNRSYTVGTSSGATGFTWSWVSNPGNNGTINSGGTTHTADVTFNKTTAAVGTYVLQVEMTGFTCGTITRNITIEIQDADCGCIAPISATEFGRFLCHNLGADPSLDPHVPVVGLNGAYIQWGKRGPNTTGNSVVDWQTAANDGPGGFAAPPTASNANAGAIIGWNTSAAADGAWNSGTEAAPVKTANDPCPTGFRVPTRNEWVGVDSNNTTSFTGPFSYSSTNYGVALHFGPDASTKLLTLPAAGFHGTDGTLYARGDSGLYWSSTENGSNAHYLVFNSTSNVYPEHSNVRTNSNTVRCIAE